MHRQEQLLIIPCIKSLVTESDFKNIPRINGKHSNISLELGVLSLHSGSLLCLFITLGASPPPPAALRLLSTMALIQHPGACTAPPALAQHNGTYSAPWRLHSTPYACSAHWNFCSTPCAYPALDKGAYSAPYPKIIMPSSAPTQWYSHFMMF